MSWGEPGFLALLWVLPVLVALLMWRERQRFRSLSQLASPGLHDRLLPPGLPWLRTWEAMATVAGLACMITALAQPRVGWQWRELERKGVDLVVVIDVSRSMDAQDVQPSRLERARRELTDLMDLVGGDRVGLVVFAAGAYPRVPLTLDHDALRIIGGELGSGTIRAQGTSLAGAIDAALHMLDQPAQSDRAILLFSDGETEDTKAAQEAASRAAEAGIPIFTIGVGTPEGAPIPLEEGGFKKDRTGQVVVSRLNEGTLQGLAATSGGAYVRSVASADDLQNLVVNEIHGRMEAGVLGVKRDKVWNERYQWPLGLGLAMVILAALASPRSIPHRIRPAASPKSSRRSGLIAIILLMAATTAQAGEKVDGARALATGDYERAIQLLSTAQADSPDDLDVAFQLGQALYGAERYNEAAGVWNNVGERSANPEMRALARYDAGHAAYKAGLLTEARDAFRQALEAREDWKEARQNAESIEKEISARTEQQPPQNQDSGGDSQGEPQDSQDGQNSQNQEEQGQQGQQDPQGQQGEQDQDQQGQQGEPDPDQAGDGTRPENPDPDTEMNPNEALSLAPGQELPERREGQPQATVQQGDPEAQQAARLLESIQEGSPRVVIDGAQSRTQDW